MEHILTAYTFAVYLSHDKNDKNVYIELNDYD